MADLPARSAPASDAGPRSADQPAGQFVFLGLLALLTFCAGCFPMMDTDFWWHLKTGELIWSTQTLPDLDWYTFTDYDKPWIDLHWGFQLLILAVWNLGGANLMVLFKAAVYLLAVLIAHQAGGRGLPAAARAAFWLLPVLAISGRAYERPEMLSLVFLAAWLWLIDRSESHPRVLWCLVPLQLLWTNCHALSVLGLVAGACLAIDRVLRRVLVPAGSVSRWGLMAAPRGGPNLLLLGALVAGTAFINPWFDEGAFFPLVLYRKFSVDQPFYSRVIGEFQRPIDFYLKHGLVNPYLVIEAWLWGVAALGLIFLALRGRWSPFRWLMFAGFSHLAWSASRNTSIFSLVAGVVLCATAAELAVLSAARPVPRLWKVGMQWTIAGVMLLLTGLVVTSTWSRITGEYKPFGLGQREAWFAHEAMQFAGRPGMPRKALIYHNGLAGTYIYHNAPRGRVYMDARLEVSTEKTFRQYLDIQQKLQQGDPRWTVTLRDETGHLPVIVLDARYSRLEISRLLSTPAFRLVYADRAAAVFLETLLADSLKLSPASDAPLRALPPN